MCHRFDRLIHLLGLTIFLVLLTTACVGQADSTAGGGSRNDPQADQGQTTSTTNSNDAAAPADSTVQAALQAALATVQGTATEGAISAAGGAQPTAQAPLLTEGPSAEIVPATGAVNTPVTVRGSGFPANVRVNVYLAGVVGAASGGSTPQSYATTNTDPDGNYSLVFTMPATWPNRAPIEAGIVAVLVATEDFATRANVSFEYIASAATPTSVALPTATARATSALPPTATPTPARNPFAEVTPPTGGAGAQVTLRGGGFPANTNVNVHLGTFDAQFGGGGAPQRYGATLTDGSGNFTVSFTMPATWTDGTSVAPGRLLLLVATNDFAKQASAILEYVAPTPTPEINPYAEVQPSSGSANTQVTIRGGGFPNNSRVRLYLSGLVTASAAGAAPTSYADTTTDRAGNYSMTFSMPSAWPDGNPIQSGTLALLIATDDFAVRASATFDYMAPTPTAVSTSGWQARYYDNPDIRNEPVLVRTDPALHFYWGSNSPDPLLPADDFSVSWQRAATFESGVYRFTIEMDDGARLYLDNLLILESWRVGSRRTLSVDYPVSGGEHTIRLDYFEDAGEALINLRWTKLEGSAPAATATPGAPSQGVLFNDDPRNNRRGINQTFCSGFESECNFAGCARNYRLVWGPYCREGDYPYIQPGLYRVTLYGTGPVRAGATDYGMTGEFFTFGQFQFELPGSFTFCWQGRASNGYGFETIVQSTGIYASVDWMTIEYLGASCP